MCHENNKSFLFSVPSEHQGLGRAASLELGVCVKAVFFLILYHTCKCESLLPSPLQPMLVKELLQT